MIRQKERDMRAAEVPLVAQPNQPGILAAMALSPGIERSLRSLAQELLVETFPGSTLTRGERELLATGVSARNNCFFCMDSHAAFAFELLEREQTDGAELLVEEALHGSTIGFDRKLVALARIADLVRKDPRSLHQGYVDEAKAAGATDGDIQLAILIAAGFSLFNRCVDGLRATTPADMNSYKERAVQIADNGYCLVATS